MFPDLKKYWKKHGGLLSGGQKQMLSIARAYVNNNELLLIDEPSKGLAPIIVEKVMESILANERENNDCASGTKLYDGKYNRGSLLYY